MKTKHQIKQWLLITIMTFFLYDVIWLAGDYDDFSRSVLNWKSHTNLTHPGKYFRPSKVKIMRPTSPK